MSGRALVLFLLLAASVSAQSNRAFPTSTLAWRVRVRLVFSSQAPCDAATRVALVSEAGAVVAEAPASSQCFADLFQVPPGTYRVNVFGGGVADSDVGMIDVDSEDSQDFEVKARRSGESDPLSAGALVSVSDLSVPPEAAKEFDKANRLIGKQDWAKAGERLRKAVGIYPNYAAAYNNLGVVYSHLGDRVQGRQALQKAISLNDHLAPAYVNLGRISIVSNNLPEAETLLGKANALAPANPTTLVLLAYVQVTDRHLDEAIATSRQAHRLTGNEHAFVHLAAANAFEQKRDTAGAIAELQIFLKEEQTGARAEAARKALASLQASPQ